MHIVRDAGEQSAVNQPLHEYRTLQSAIESGFRSALSGPVQRSAAHVWSIIGRRYVPRGRCNILAPLYEEREQWHKQLEVLTECSQTFEGTEHVTNDKGNTDSIFGQGIGSKQNGIIQPSY